MPAQREPLSRDRVLDAAIALADERGLESVSMRALAQELGAGAMSLYNHVANRQDLVQAMVDRVIEEIDLPENAPDWEAAVRACAVSAHEAFVRHPWACGPAMSGGGAPSAASPRLSYIEWLLRTLREAGFSPEQAYDAYHALDSHILGFTLWELGHAAGARQISGDEVLADFAGKIIPQLRQQGFANVAAHAEQHLAAGEDGESEFEFGLDLILDGLERARTSS
jgi:AcrR family transcriptional regulator